MTDLRGGIALREYNRIHKWIARHWNKSGICEFCFKTCKTQWSNKTGQYIQDRIDWQELCPKCHHRYDVVKLGKKQAAGRPIIVGHELKIEAHDLKWGNLESVEARLKTYAWYKAETK